MVTDRRKLVNVFLLYYIVSTTNNTRTTSRTTSRSGTDKVVICINREKRRVFMTLDKLNGLNTWPARALYAELNCKTWWWSGSDLCWLCILIEEESCIMEIWWLNQTSEFGQNCVMNNFWWGLIWSSYFIFSSLHTQFYNWNKTIISSQLLRCHYICQNSGKSGWCEATKRTYVF